MTTIEFPGSVLESANITPEEVRRELAIRLYEQKRLSMHQAHLLAGTDSAADFYNLVVQRTAAESHLKPDQPRLAELEALAARLLNTMEVINLAARNSLESTFVRSPLHSIMGYSKAMVNGSAGRVTEEQKDLLNSIFASAQHLLNQLDILIDIRPYVLGRFEISFREANVVSFTEDFLSAIKSETKFRLEREIPADIPPVMVDHVEMLAAIAYLVKILLEIHPAGEGRLDLTAGYQKPWVTIALSTDKGEEWVISPNPALYIIQSVFEMHGGNVEIRDLNEKGWEIVLRLPAKTQAQ